MGKMVRSTRLSLAWGILFFSALALHAVASNYNINIYNHPFLGLVASLLIGTVCAFVAYRKRNRVP
jgi:hypothetical protein